MENEDTVGSFSTFLCSSCMKSGFPVSSMHVVPAWNESWGFVTSYRCDRCRMESLGDTLLRLAVPTEEVRESFCQFLGFHDYADIAEMIRKQPLDRAAEMIRKFLGMVESGEIELDP